MEHTPSGEDRVRVTLNGFISLLLQQRSLYKPPMVHLDSVLHSGDMFALSKICEVLGFHKSGRLIVVYLVVWWVKIFME